MVFFLLRELLRGNCYITSSLLSMLDIGLEMLNGTLDIPALKLFKGVSYGIPFTRFGALAKSISGAIISYILVVKMFRSILEKTLWIWISLSIFLAVNSSLKTLVTSLIAYIFPVFICLALTTWPKLPSPSNSNSWY